MVDVIESAQIEKYNVVKFQELPDWVGDKLVVNRDKIDFDEDLNYLIFLFEELRWSTEDVDKANRIQEQIDCNKNWSNDPNSVLCQQILEITLPLIFTKRKEITKEILNNAFGDIQDNFKMFEILLWNICSNLPEDRTITNVVNDARKDEIKTIVLKQSVINAIKELETLEWEIRSRNTFEWVYSYIDQMKNWLKTNNEKTQEYLARKKVIEVISELNILYSYTNDWTEDKWIRELVMKNMAKLENIDVSSQEFYDIKWSYAKILPLQERKSSQRFAKKNQYKNWNNEI